MKDIKTVNFHNVLGSAKSSSFFEQCFQVFVREVAHKCETTIISRIYTLRDKENRTSFVGNNDVVVHRSVKQPPIWTPISDYSFIPSQVMPLATGNIQIRSDKTFDNTWNMHVILMRDIHSFDQISRDDTTFEWNSHDRFVVLIARFPERHEPSNESNSKIDNILKTLWSKRKVQKIFVSGAIFLNDTIQINRIVRTYNPFAKVNDSGS